jgi:hypothetical protein
MNAKTWKTWNLDKSRIYDGLVFATPGERCRYIGTWVRDRPQWLKTNVGRWRRVEDVQQEAASPAPPVESEVDLGAEPAGPNGQTSSRGVQDNGGDEGDVALVDTLSGDCSLPCQQTSLPTPVTATLTSWSTKAELLPPAKAAMSETKQPKTDTTPLGAVGRKRGRSGGRQPKKQKPPAGIARSTPKLCPELMLLVLDALAERPFLYHAANKAGIHRKTLAYWIRRSEAGDNGYDIKWQRLTWRFHEHCKSAIWEAELKLLDSMFERALFGYDKVLTRRGRVVYKIDQDLVERGFQGPDAYLRDENGNPVPETVRKVDMKAMRFILEWYRPDTWGKHPKIDAPRQGGVLVIGDVTKKPKYNTAASVKARKWKSWSRKIREEKD